MFRSPLISFGHYVLLLMEQLWQRGAFRLPRQGVPGLTMGALLFLVTVGPIGGVQAQELLPPLAPHNNRLTGEWLLYQPEQNQLVPYLPEYHPARNALYQWVHIQPRQAFRITFKAKKDLSLFLDNQLVFTADSPAIYTLDLARDWSAVGARPGRTLLCVWHPTDQPDYASFGNTQEEEPAVLSTASSRRLVNLSREERNQNPFILFLLFIGLIYGGLKVGYPGDFGSLFRISNFLRSSTLEEGFLARPIGSWAILFFILAFSLSFSLLIVAIHTDVQQIYLFNRLFSVSEADIVSRILFYTFLIFLFFILKYLFLKLMGFVFDLSPLVRTQYREFVRSNLFMGLALPVIMLLYLTLNASLPTTVLWISRLVVSALLIISSLRIFLALNKKASLLNLHLFSYICATEVIPLMIILKLVVFTY